MSTTATSLLDLKSWTQHFQVVVSTCMATICTVELGGKQDSKQARNDACRATGSPCTLYSRAHQVLLPYTGLASYKEAQAVCKTVSNVCNGSVIALVGLLSPILGLVD